jgi:hypothetical protein
LVAARKGVAKVVERRAAADQRLLVRCQRLTDRNDHRFVVGGRRRRTERPAVSAREFRVGPD